MGARKSKKRGNNLALSGEGRGGKENFRKRQGRGIGRLGERSRSGDTRHARDRRVRRVWDYVNSYLGLSKDSKSVEQARVVGQERKKRRISGEKKIM